MRVRNERYKFLQVFPFVVIDQYLVKLTCLKKQHTKWLKRITTGKSWFTAWISSTKLITAVSNKYSILKIFYMNKKRTPNDFNLMLIKVYIYVLICIYIYIYIYIRVTIF